MVTQTIKAVFLIITFAFFACDELGDLIDEDLPEIEGGLKVSRTTVYPQDTILASVNASNPIEGDLTYKWEKTGGTFVYQFDPSTVKWVAPNESGDYTITIKVSNDEGTTNASREIEVLPAQQPVINGDIILSDNNVYALDTVTAYISATNPREGPLSYLWTSSGGRFIYPADEATVKWIAPLTGGSYTLTVVVSNGLSSVQASRGVYVNSATAPIVEITNPPGNSFFYLGETMNVSVKAVHENGIAFVRLYVSHAGHDSLIQTLGGHVSENYNFAGFQVYEEMVGSPLIWVEAESASQLSAIGADQISVNVLGIHVGKK